jgi:CheY-like chemotaxis protein
MKRVLVIDDDDGVRESFRAALEDAGYAVTTDDNGASGLESAQAQRPDLVFLDLKMPGLSGVETLKRLNSACPHTPVYVVTGFYGEFLAPLRDLRSNGVDFNLARKPLSATEIKAIAAGRIGALDPLTIGTSEILPVGTHGARP